MRDDLQDPYYRPRNSNAFASMVLILIGITIGMVLIVTLRACDAKPEPVTAQQDCTGCHYPPAITSYKQYRRFHQRPTAEDKRLAQELKEQEYIISQLTGAK